MLQEMTISYIVSLYEIIILKNYFYLFPSNLIEWNKLDLNIRNSQSLTSFEGKF